MGKTERRARGVWPEGNASQSPHSHRLQPTYECFMHLLSQ